MGALVRIPITNPDDLVRDYGVGALIRLERSATEAGAYAEIETTLLDDDTYSYEIWDDSGGTTFWYRYRVSDAAGTIFSVYSDPQSPAEPLAYATLDDLLLTMSQPTTDTRVLANAEKKLREATLDLDREIGYSALRETGSWVWHGVRGNVLHVHRGIISLDSVEIRYAPNDVYTMLQVQDTGWVLEGMLGQPQAVDGVYYHVRLLETGLYTSYPETQLAIRLTGTLGGNPESRKAACVAWARQAMGMDNSPMGGVISGPDELSGGLSIDRWPRKVYDLVMTEHRRWMACP
jgi:hypothetical protein